MDDATPEVDLRERRLQTACLLFLSLLAAGVTLWLLRPVLVPFVLALFFVIGLSPLLDLIQRRLEVGRPAAIGISFLLGFALIVGFGMLLTSSVLTITGGQFDLELLVRRGATFTAEVLEDLGLMEEESQLQFVIEAHEFAGRQTRTVLIWLGGALVDLLISLGVVSVFMFFLLAGASSEARPTTGLWAEIEGKIRGYIVTKTAISFFTGLAFGLVLAVFRVPMAIELGVLAFLLNYVPNVGPVIASALPIPLVLFAMPEAAILTKALAIAAGVAVQVISGNVVEPKIMGDSFELHPIVILLSLILWGIIWGPVGVLLAVPMTAAVKILLERLEQTRPVAALLAGHITPLESALDQGGVA